MCGHYYDAEIYSSCSRCGSDEAVLAYRGRGGEDDDNALDFRPGRATEN